jgi:hypothetical protein
MLKSNNSSFNKAITEMQQQCATKYQQQHQQKQVFNLITATDTWKAAAETAVQYKATTTYCRYYRKQHP